MGKTVAIIIPAYKRRFLHETLASIARQTCRDFKVYIGDDASPEDLKPVVDSYKDQIDLLYHRFGQNMGRTDLVGHWERCIALSEEPLIWLFSDDDIMPADGVARIVEAAGKHGTEKVMFRFPLEVTDEAGHTKFRNPPFEAMSISGYELLLQKMSCQISSAAVEYVFSRDVWQQTGGFVKFPLAWCSDDATWAQFADYAGGIIALPGAAVYWRNAEGSNISNSACYDREKLKATQLFLDWIGQRYSGHRGEEPLREALKTYIRTILRCSVRGHFSLRALIRISLSLNRIDSNAAWYIFKHHIGKIKSII